MHISLFVLLVIKMRVKVILLSVHSKKQSNRKKLESFTFKEYLLFYFYFQEITIELERKKLIEYTN